MPRGKIYHHSQTRVQVPVNDCVLALIREDFGEGPIGRFLAEIIHKKYAGRLNCRTGEQTTAKTKRGRGK